METVATWFILLRLILSIVAVAPILGFVIGKYIVKRQKSSRKALLSTGERVAYIACFALGVALMLLGVFYKIPEADANTPPDDMVITDNGGLQGETHPGEEAEFDDGATAGDAAADETDDTADIGGEDGIALANVVAFDKG